MGETRALAEFAARFSIQQIPPEVIHLSERCLLDYLGVTLAGWHEPTVRIAQSVLTKQHSGTTASLLGGGRASGLDAALLNGIASHVLDFDDTHDPTILHGSGPILSAALAAAEMTGAPSSALVAAHTIAFEVAARVALAVHPDHYDRGFHVTGTAGTLGAAAAAGRLLGLDEEQMAHALSTAAAQAAGLREMFGSMTKSLHAGKAAANGFLSALLAQEGWVSAPAGLEGRRGYWSVLASDADPSRATDGLGQCWELHRNGFKPYACGVVTHPVIDGVSALARTSRMAATEIAEIRCRVNPYVLELTGKREPQTGLEGKFSIFHCAAVAYLDGTARLRQFTDDAVLRPEVVALRQLVRAEADSSLPTSGAQVSVHTKDGRSWTTEVTAAKGTPDNPMTDQDLTEKFLDVAGPYLGPRGADSICRRALTAGSLKNVRELIDLVEQAQAEAA